jgi:hypothetical protein
VRDVDAVSGQTDVARAADLAAVPEGVLHNDGLVGLREHVSLHRVAEAVQGAGVPEGALIQGIGSSKAVSMASVAPRLAALVTSEAVHARARRYRSTEVSLRNAAIQAPTWS